MMKENVIILTSGLSGSSVLAGLIAQGGWWLGDKTFKKSDYDTYENQKLIELNRQLFEQVGYDGNYEMIFDSAELDSFARPPVDIDRSEYQAFLAECDQHSPWLWKDPRLWLTIYFWKDLLDFNKVKFVHLTRDPMQAWVSLTIRRQIQEFGYLKSYLYGIQDSIRTFLDQADAQFLEIEYEDLLIRPEDTIGKLNDFIGSSLDVGDLRKIYRGDLYKKPKGLADTIKAGLIYAKNYGERYR